MLEAKLNRLNALNKEAQALRAEIIEDLKTFGVQAVFVDVPQSEVCDWRDLREGDTLYVDITSGPRFKGTATVAYVEPAEYRGDCPVKIQYKGAYGLMVWDWIDVTEDDWSFVSRRPEA